MKTSKKLQEEIGALLDKVQAISALTDKENREPTADEQAEVDRIMGKADDKSAGALAKLEEQLAQVKRIEAAAERHPKGAPQASVTLTPTQAGEPGEQIEEPSRLAKITVPARCRYRHNSLRAYKGTDADKAAYMAGRFFLATIFGDAKSQEVCRNWGLDTEYRAAVRESENDLGGFLVPEEMETSIISLRETYGVFRREAKVVPMIGDTKNMPRRTGGVTAYFGGENGSMTESTKAWDQIKLVAKKLYALTRYSTEISEDAIINIGDDLTDEIAYAFSVKEDQCGFVGDGTSTYGGIVGVSNAVKAGSIITAASGHTGFGTLTFADFETCIGALPNYAERNPKWYISKAGWGASMLRLLDAAGGNTLALLQSGVDPNKKYFMGFEVVISQALNNTLGADVSKPKVLFGDLNLAASLGNRRGLSIKQSDDRYFETDEIGIRGTERFDINVHEQGTATVAGAILVLKSAAS